MPTTPPPREPEGQPPARKRGKHYDTPTRAKTQGVVEFCESEDVEFAFDTPLKQKAFKHFDVAKTQGYDIIKRGSARTFHNKVENEVRGRPYKVTPAQVREADSLLEEVALEFEGKALTWEQVATEVGAAVSGKTMRSTLKAALNYHKCLACLKGWLDDKMI